MRKSIVSIFGLLIVLIVSVLFTGTLSAAAAPAPNVTFTLLSGLPATMNVGDTANVVVRVTSDQKFIFAMMLPDFWFPGRGMMATNMGGDRVFNNTTATLTVTFIAKNSTARLPNEGACPTGGVAPVRVVVGVRFVGGFVTYQPFPETGYFCVTVP